MFGDWASPAQAPTSDRNPVMPYNFHFDNPLTHPLFSQAPLLPEAFLTSDGAASMETFFSKQPAGLINSGAITQDDIAWYRAAILKPGELRVGCVYPAGQGV